MISDAAFDRAQRAYDAMTPEDVYGPESWHDLYCEDDECDGDPCEHEPSDDFDDIDIDNFYDDLLYRD